MSIASLSSSPPLRLLSRHPHLAGFLFVLLLLLAGFAFGELAGWPWLAGPLERALGERLGRTVELVETPGGERMRVSLLGEVDVHAARLRIGGPDWRNQANTLDAGNVTLRLRYRDLWAWKREDKPLRIKELSAESLDADLLRRADGSATWQLGRVQSADGRAAAAPPLLRFDRLLLNRASLAFDDAPLQLKAHIEASLSDKPSPLRQRQEVGLTAHAEGRYRGKPMTAAAETGSPLPWVGASDDLRPVPLALRLEAGAVKFGFEGVVRDLLGLRGLDGRLKLAGPSLAAIGDPLGVTLPTTPAFDAEGRLSRPGDQLWHVDVERALLGRSRLNGSFDFRPADAGRRQRPLLSGRLGGDSLWFADLAPTIGAPAPEQPAAADGRLLPDRRFDLPSLRAMDANVEVALRRVDLGRYFAVPIAPLNARIVLNDGVLTLSDIDARSASGRIAGRLSLDGREDVALWQARLRWAGVRLEQWIRQGRRPDQPPYVSGLLNGRLALDGRGRSTAELLASASGRAQLHLPSGKISHLAVEAAGIDIAQGLGILVRGDDSLAMQCAVADLNVRRGKVVPTVMLVDTRDSTLFVDGQIALDTEKIDLRLKVLPKDFSPLSLRTPVLVRGSLADPDVSLEPKPLMVKLLPAALLAAIHPLAALLPLIDDGEDKDGHERALLQSCQRLNAVAVAKG
ncbi:AsmA family protein [Roseateles violae]|uniref:AsmA family protein n=1 Tax=Roseateles violae TaxID=3058042 RepID=A0ABT8DY05_9BURK|nr:AsmA family protein [Pelomonas sp. PFR6]MDN3922618.1 AsmA family protein [Pelomonas sp. PFR6]